MAKAAMTKSVRCGAVTTEADVIIPDVFIKSITTEETLLGSLPAVLIACVICLLLAGLQTTDLI